MRPMANCWVAPLHTIPKDNAEWRPCEDYRALNTCTFPDRYPVQHIGDFTQTLRGKKIFPKIDFVLVFNQITVAEEDIEPS